MITTHTGLEFLLRDPTPADDAYCLSTMCRTVCCPGRTPPPAYRDVDRLGPVERELRRRWVDPDYTRVVATVPGEDPWLVAGFIVGRPGLLTYCGVRSGLTGQGLATALLGVLGIRRDVPGTVEFATWDLERPNPGDNFPAGILRTGRWPHLHLIPWRETR